MSAASEQDLDMRLAAVLERHNATTCPKCGRAIDRGDVAWNAGQTEAGTGNSWVEIQCQRCDTEIANVFSWWPDAETFEEAVEILETDWRPR